MPILSRISWLVLVCQILTLSSTPLHAGGSHGFDGPAEAFFVRRPLVCVPGELNPGCVAPVRKTLRVGAGAVGLAGRAAYRSVGVAAGVTARTAVLAGRVAAHGAVFAARSAVLAGHVAARTAGFAGRAVLGTVGVASKVVGGTARFLLFGRVFR